MRNIQEQLRAMMSGTVAGGNGGLSVLSDVGISFQKDGSLTLDSNKLNKVLADPTKDIKSLFVNNGNGSVGFGSRINTLVSNMIFGNDAMLNSRVNGLNASIKELGTRKDALNIQLASIQERYTRQFTALDSTVASMQSTSSYLTQQLAALKTY